MTASMTRMPVPILALLIGLLAPALAFAQPALGGAMGGQSHGPLPVGVITLKETDVPYEVTLPGRAVAYEQSPFVPV